MVVVILAKYLKIEKNQGKIRKLGSDLLPTIKSRNTHHLVIEVGIPVRTMLVNDREQPPVNIRKVH